MVHTPRECGLICSLRAVIDNLLCSEQLSLSFLGKMAIRSCSWSYAMVQKYDHG